MSPGLAKSSSSGSMTTPREAQSPAASTSAPVSGSFQARWHSWSSQKPVRLRSSRMPPSVRTSLVSPARSAAASRTGLGTAAPMRLQDPEEMNRRTSSPARPSAWTAQAVSCPPGRTMVIPSGVAPATVASSTSGGIHPSGIPLAWSTRADHSRAPGEASPVVEAIARPACAGAPSRWATRSGRGRKRSTRSMRSGSCLRSA